MPDGLAKLKIEAFTDRRFTNPAPVPVIIVPINPERYSRSGSISYTDPKPPGSAGGSPVFDKMGRETVSFELVFDGTGVVPLPVGVPISTGRKKQPSRALNVSEQIKNLKTVAYAYNGKTHEPHYLKLAWGTFSFKCRLTTLNVSYNLFAPDGTPLRATASTSFEGYTDEYILQAMMNRSSPDLTHVLTVQAGDTLPLMCHRIYGRSHYYSQVAEANGLTSFRDLEPGMQLVFPPLAGPA